MVKKAKQDQPATSLCSDWRKMVGINKKRMKCVTAGYEDNNDSITSPTINAPNHSCPSSQTSVCSSDILSNMSADRTNEILRVFNDDEGLNSIHMAHHAKCRGKSKVRAGSGAATTTQTTSLVAFILYLSYM